MIQRKQSVFLLLSVILGVLTLSVQFYSWVMFVVLLLAASLNLYTIFLYKNRMLQVRMSVFSALLQIGFYVAAGVFIYMLKDDLQASFRPGWALALPFICIILNYLAFRATYADEVMVRASERLR